MSHLGKIYLRGVQIVTGTLTLSNMYFFLNQVPKAHQMEAFFPVALYSMMKGCFYGAIWPAIPLTSYCGAKHFGYGETLSLKVTPKTLYLNFPFFRVPGGIIIPADRD